MPADGRTLRVFCTTNVISVIAMVAATPAATRERHEVPTSRTNRRGWHLETAMSSCPDTHSILADQMSDDAAEHSTEHRLVLRDLPWQKEAERGRTDGLGGARRERRCCSRRPGPRRARTPLPAITHRVGRRSPDRTRRLS